MRVSEFVIVEQGEERNLEQSLCLERECECCSWGEQREAIVDQGGALDSSILSKESRLGELNS